MKMLLSEEYWGKAGTDQGFASADAIFGGM
jgi:hypothetical protein